MSNGPRLVDVDALPSDQSLQARVLSAGGIAVAWLTIDGFGRPTPHEQGSPADPVFYLRRPRGERAHVWRLFRTRDEALEFAGEQDDPGAVAWARALPSGRARARGRARSRRREYFPGTDPASRAG